MFPGILMTMPKSFPKHSLVPIVNYFKNMQSLGSSEGKKDLFSFFFLKLISFFSLSNSTEQRFFFSVLINSNRVLLVHDPISVSLGRLTEFASVLFLGGKFTCKYTGLFFLSQRLQLGSSQTANSFEAFLP